LILFTVGLSNGTMRERARREANVGADLILRASGAFGLSGSESFRLTISLTQDLKKIEGVREVVPIGQISVSAGVGLISHGYTKLPPSEQFVQLVGNIGFPIPHVFAWAAALSESVGGVLLILGFLTRITSFFCRFHDGNGFDRSSSERSFPKARAGPLILFHRTMFPAFRCKFLEC